MAKNDSNYSTQENIERDLEVRAEDADKVVGGRVFCGLSPHRKESGK